MSQSFSRIASVLAIALGVANAANSAQQCFLKGTQAPTIYGNMTVTVAGNCGDNVNPQGPFAALEAQSYYAPGFSTCTYTFSKPVLTSSITAQVHSLGAVNLTVSTSEGAYQPVAADIGEPLAGSSATNPISVFNAAFRGTTAPESSGTLRLTNNLPPTITSVTFQQAGTNQTWVKLCADDADVWAPTRSVDNYSTAANSGLTVAAPGVLANDVSTGGAMTAALVTGPANGTLTLNDDGSFVYIPNSDFIGTDTFTYTASADGLASDPVTVTLSVTAAAPAPTTANPVPAIGAWGLLALSSILGLAGFFGFSRRRKA